MLRVRYEVVIGENDSPFLAQQGTLPLESSCWRGKSEIIKKDKVAYFCILLYYLRAASWSYPTPI